jgi:hypothetical protein
MVPLYPGGTGFGNTRTLLFVVAPSVAVLLNEQIPFEVAKNISAALLIDRDLLNIITQ